jgi:hypothetical protein
MKQHLLPLALIILVLILFAIWNLSGPLDANGARAEMQSEHPSGGTR